MKKLVLFLLLSVAVADSGYAFIFGGGAWRRHYRSYRRGLISQCRVVKSDHLFCREFEMLLMSS